MSLFGIDRLLADPELRRPLEGKRVALLDDVMTTGASLNALAETVKAAGAIHVECWVVARTLPE